MVDGNREREIEKGRGKDIREWICRFAPQRQFNVGRVKRRIRRNKGVNKRIIKLWYEVINYALKLNPLFLRSELDINKK